MGSIIAEIAVEIEGEVRDWKTKEAVESVVE